MKYLVALLAVASFAGSASAEDYGELPAPTPFAPLPYSIRTGEVVFVPPFGLLPVRVYATPAQGPFYNVPPFKVVAPY